MAISSEDAAWLQLVLDLGPAGAFDGYTDEQLERGWGVYRDQILADRKTPGSRPWAWWTFEAHEEQPADGPAEALRLIELDELAGDEISAVRRRARESLADIEACDEAENAGAIMTGPIGAADRMRERRETDAAAWQHVLAAIG
jgi:hypothetical protein